MINIKTPREIELMRVAGEIVGDTHKYLIPFLKPGITTKKIDSLARDYIIKRGATPSCYHYEGYPGNICISVCFLFHCVIYIFHSTVFFDKTR